MNEKCKNLNEFSAYEHLKFSEIGLSNGHECIIFYQVNLAIYEFWTHRQESILKFM